jgi:hypothetical protein
MFLVMQFSSPSCYLFPVPPSYYPEHLVLNTLRPYSYFNGRDQVPHPYRITGKIIVLFITIVTFFDSRREDRRFWTEWWQALSGLLSISPSIQFCFVAVVCKDLNCDTFSSDLFAVCMFIH